MDEKRLLKAGRIRAKVADWKEEILFPMLTTAADPIHEPNRHPSVTRRSLRRRDDSFQSERPFMSLERKAEKEISPR